MGTLIVPQLEPGEQWPTLGPGVCDLIEERAVFGPGSLRGLPAVLDPEKRAIIYRAYEVYPQGHEYAGRRRFQRVGVSVRKGTAKTELLGWITFVELHPEGPVRCDGFDSSGNPIGRPVRDPYIPMLAYTEEQVTELAYQVLYTVVTEGPDANLFDAQKERIHRLSPVGKSAGVALPLSNSPNARDGARTTFQCFDEPHRMYLPNQRAAHETMLANMPKRPLEDPWAMYASTAGEPGQNSIQEDLHREAEQIKSGEITDPQLFYFHREAEAGHDMGTMEGRIAAISEATGPVGEYAPGQFRSIALQWDRPGADAEYLERVWTNRWIRSQRQAFDVKLWKNLGVQDEIPAGAFVAAGFDGARFQDSTAIVLTDIRTGRQQLYALWERPLDVEDWEVPEDEVTAAVMMISERYKLYKVYADPPHWVETVGSWANRLPGQVEEWWTNRPAYMAKAIRAYREAMSSGAVTYVNRGIELDRSFDSHVAAAGRHNINMWLDGEQMFLLNKIHPDRKYDAAVAGLLSWASYLDAVKTGAEAPEDVYVPVRIR
jgi:hypothetical protein